MTTPTFNQITLPCAVGEVSDGFHTFNELYDHRCLLFLALMKAHPEQSWFALAHDNGEVWAGWFIAGMVLPTGKAITYHLPDKFWTFAEASGAKALRQAPKWDGHTSKDVIARLHEWL